VDIRQAKAKLDHVIEIARVEMYKPIQVAEALRHAALDPSIDLGDLTTYRIKSRRWRDEATSRLFNKKSTSSVRYQDDLWNDTAVPPGAMVVLGKANCETHCVEAYIYRKVLEKSNGLEAARSTLADLESIDELVGLLARFESTGMTSSADRLFEVFATSVYQAELDFMDWLVEVSGPPKPNAPSASWSFLEPLLHGSMKLRVDRPGRTNAADAGLDIWTNFGVVISVKRRLLTAVLLNEIVEDTPLGKLHVVCRSMDPSGELRLKELASLGRAVTASTESDLLDSAEHLLSMERTRVDFVSRLVEYFDHEFPAAETLIDFLDERGYLDMELPKLWTTR
jgi:hypothetical protein